jgi:CubicO group peptidase (beta-lactamase class C family)
VWATPAYSNSNFRVLSYVIEAITKTEFAATVESDVIRPLGLSNTFSLKPKDSVGIIPDGDSSWGIDVGQDLGYVVPRIPLSSLVM